MNSLTTIPQSIVLTLTSRGHSYTHLRGVRQILKWIKQKSRVFHAKKKRLHPKKPIKTCWGILFLCNYERRTTEFKWTTGIMEYDSWLAHPKTSSTGDKLIPFNFKLWKIDILLSRIYLTPFALILVRFELFKLTFWRWARCQQDGSPNTHTEKVDIFRSIHTLKRLTFSGQLWLTFKSSPKTLPWR